MFFKQILEDKLSQKIKKITPVSGGDINKVYSIETNEGIFILKTNTCSDYPHLFEKEKKGLETIRKAGALTPKIIQVFNNSDHQFLLLEFIEEGLIKNDYWKLFAKDMATIHKTTSKFFGLEYDNYIGSLIQKNQNTKTWKIFFIENRIQPLVKMAFDKNLLQEKHMQQFKKLFLRLNEILPKEIPSLLHGDLWSGNLMNKKGIAPVFIDPAIYFGHREMDIAMTQLFGGFNSIYLQYYLEIFPLEKGWEQRLKIHNLYPKLVHLNLFGSAYLSGIESVIKPY